MFAVPGQCPVTRIPFGQELPCVVSTQVPSASKPLLIGTVQSVRLMSLTLSSTGDMLLSDGMAKTVNGMIPQRAVIATVSFMVAVLFWQWRMRNAGDMPMCFAWTVDLGHSRKGQADAPSYKRRRDIV